MSSSGGERVAQVLSGQGVRFLYTLCGGHISPVLVACKARGIRVVDVRHEASAVFAADATARLSGVPGVAAVTAGPGVTNAITALVNARMAQSPLVLLGGATATLLKGRGSLQDIDQASVVSGCVKWQARVERLRELEPVLQRAFQEAVSGVPGPVFVELPIDLLYPETLVREWYAKGTAGGKGLGGLAMRLYMERHLHRLLDAPPTGEEGLPPAAPPQRDPPLALLALAARRLRAAKRPLLVVGSQALTRPQEAQRLAAAVSSLGVPVYLAGMARGLLGRSHPLQLFHRRRAALRQSDLVLLCGVPCDFRLEYGRAIGRQAALVAVNLEARALFKNRAPSLPIPADPGRFLQGLAGSGPFPGWAGWCARLREADQEREREIAAQAAEAVSPVNPLRLCQGIEAAMAEESLVVADGGDFVGSAAYVLRPRGPLSWLDPGVFGTLGVGGGFALAAALCRPGAETWLLWGDGAAGLSLMELDSFARHGLPVIAVVGNDAGWAQIARDQVALLHDDVGTVLARCDYERVAEGLGGVGLRIGSPEEIEPVLAEAQAQARAGRPVLVNALLGRTGFREGSISM